ncbi:MAG: hypothetical protein WD009_10015 [Phycisphaeraceae bacterium]
MPTCRDNLHVADATASITASRYLDVLLRDDGLLATWQQAQPDGSQP